MPKTFLKYFTVLVSVGAAAVAAVNLLVDPYSMFGSPRIKEFNANKIDFVEHLRLTNVYAVSRIQPDALIIGTSRVGRGLSPTHPAWNGFTCYNLAMPAISIYESLRYLQHAMAIRPLRRVVVGLDLRIFQPRTGPTDIIEHRLKVDAEGQANFNLFSAVLPDLASALLSADALRDALRTVRYQSWLNMTLTDKGHWLSLNHTYDHAKAFRAYSENTFRRYAEFGAQPFNMAWSMQPFRKILELAHQRRIDIRFAILPSHAWHWEAMRLSGLAPRFDEIKTELLRINVDVAKKWNREPFPIWDFSGFNQYSTEAVPSSKDQGMHWFWDPVHFKSALGDLMLDRIFDLDSEKTTDFGVRLDRTGVPEHQASRQQAELAYRTAHSRDLKEIESIFNEVNRH